MRRQRISVFIFYFLLKLEDSLSKIIHRDQEVDKVCQEQYLLIVLQLKQYLKAVTVANDILITDPKNASSLETICLAFVEEEHIPISLEKVGEVIDTFLSEYSNNNVHGLLAKARWLLLHQKSLEAKQLLELLNKKEATPSSQLLLCDAYQQLQQWSKMGNTCRNRIDSSESDKLFWNLKLIKSLLEEGGEKCLNEASSLLNLIRDEAKSSLTFKLLEIASLLRTAQLEKCKNKLDLLEEDQQTESMEQVMLLKAEYLGKIGKEDEAIELLDRACEQHPQNVYLLLSAAKMLWNWVNQRQKSIAILLNVIKINRDIAEPYILLGIFYGEQRQNLSSLQRAIRCLEKAFQLDPYETRTSEHLLELYLLIDDISSGVKLLEVVVQSNSKNRRWGWLQKGLLHLKIRQNEKEVFDKEKEAGRAIMCLQNALAIESNDSAAWEALGIVL